MVHEAFGLNDHTPDDLRPNYRPQAAFALWARMTAFLAERLHAA